jgi:betaine-aldehyde dehydrogenase
MTETFSPSTGESLGKVAEGSQKDGELAIAAARTGFETWRAVAPLERAKVLRDAAAIIRKHGEELAMALSHKRS